MAISLPRTELALAECRGFLDAVAAAVPELDSSTVAAYLAWHISVVLCGEVEASITACFDEMIDRAKADPVVTKLAKTRKGVTRSAKYGDIGAALDLVAHDARVRFESEVMATVGEPGVARLGNVVGVRDKTAHDVPPAITFHELEEATDIAKQVIAAVRVVLQLP